MTKPKPKNNPQKSRLIAAAKCSRTYQVQKEMKSVETKVLGWVRK